MNDGLKDKHRQAIIRILASNPKVERVVLFGSRAMGTHTPASDVDIALFGDALTLDDQARLSAKGDDLPVPQRIDLLCHNAIKNRKLLDHIKKHGVEWYRREDRNSRPSRTAKANSAKHDRKDAGRSAMASEWRQNTLEALLSFSNGRTSPDRAYGLPYPVYGSNGIIGYSTETNAGENSLIIGRVGSYCGSVYLSRSRCWVTDNAIRAEAINGNDPRYIFYLLNSLNLNHWRGGSGQPLLNQAILNSIAVSSPPPEIQRRIAHILGTLDDKIDLNRRMNRTLEKMAAGIFKSWFIDFDPVHAKADGRDPGLPAEIADLFPDSFEESELGAIPTGWTPGSLGDMADSPRRGVKPSDVPPTTPYIGLEHMPRRCIALDAWGRAENVASGKSQFKQGEILFGKLRPYFHKVGIAPVDGVCSTDIVVVTPKASHWHGYVISLVSSKAFVDYTDSHSAGTKMPRTNWKDMSRYPLALPPEPLVKAFQDHVAALHKRLGVNVRQNRRLAGLRDTLLPKLLSGEIELPDVEAVVEEVL